MQAVDKAVFNRMYELITLNPKPYTINPKP